MIDRRNRKTIKSIENVFIELLCKKDINKISVTEICNNADINRGTFYLHFSDIKNLSESIQDRILENVEDNLQNRLNIKNKNTDFIVSILENLKEYKSFLLALSINSDIEYFAKKFSNIIHRALIESNDSLNLKTDKKFLEYFTAYFAGATSGIVANWIKNECRDRTQEVAEFIFNVTFEGIRYYKEKEEI